MLRRHAMLALAGSAVPLAIAARGNTALAAAPYYPTFEVLQIGTVAKVTSQILLERSTNPYTRAFAPQEVIEQDAAAQALTSNFAPARPKLTDAQQAIVNNIRHVAAAQLDYAYVAAQIQGHQSLLAIQNKALTDFAAYPNYDIVHIALLLRSNIRQHLAVLAEILTRVSA